MSHYPVARVHLVQSAQEPTDPMAHKVTNTELALKLDAIKEETDKQSEQLRILTERIQAVEIEAKVAKWLLRLLGAVFGSIVTYLIAHFRSK